MKRLRLVISKSAKQDLVEIWTYIAQDSPRHADDFVDLLYDKCQLIAESPEIGRTRDELATGLRFLPVRRYLIFYRRSGQDLEIVRVVSGYRDIDDLF